MAKIEKPLMSKINEYLNRKGSLTNEQYLDQQKKIRMNTNDNPVMGGGHYTCDKCGQLVTGSALCACHLMIPPTHNQHTTNPDSNTPMSNEEHPSSWIKARILSEYRKHIKIDWPEIAARKIYSTIEDNIISGYESELARLNQTIADIEKERNEFANQIIKCQDFLSGYITPKSGISDHDCINTLIGILDNIELVKLIQQFKLQTKGNEK